LSIISIHEQRNALLAAAEWSKVEERDFGGNYSEPVADTWIGLVMIQPD